MSIIKVFYCIILVQIIFVSYNLANTSKLNYPELRTEDFIYNNTIKSVNLFTVANPPDIGILEMNKPPQNDIAQESPFYLEFDEIGSQPENYYVKILNCNADWTVSNMNDIQYLEKYNEYPILDRQLSFNTRVGFVHYKILLPKVLVSGNFLIVVYKNGTPDDIVLTKRFIIFENKLSIKMMPQFPLNMTDRNTGQQIDFNIIYGQYELINPMANVRVVLRQNFRWDNAIYNLKPSFIDENSRILQYQFFNRENVFDGSNEFRYFDIRSNRFGGQNVAKVSFDSDKTEVYLAEDFSRNQKPYSFYLDFMDGRYVINNYESGDRELVPDYVNVTFILNTPILNNEDVYVIGSFNNWSANNSSRMSYEPSINKYICKILLKQGQYNYRYATVSKNSKIKNEASIEGSHSITQNKYDVLVYFRPFGAISDRLIGYSSINYNGR
ncbi:MAG: DUF5103 domain-containing protein [Cytophagales bacterium]|nr:MAG: DUF5103 domain-containing protein [Cytophagales bacterium]